MNRNFVGYIIILSCLLSGERF